MATITTDLICNLNQPVAATFLHGNLFSQDNAGNTINVHVMDNGEPATIGGTVSANVIRADGNTVAVSGSLSGNQCSVVLPQACYAVPGRVEIIIKLTQSTTITTIAAIVANVYRSTTDTVVDPGTIIPSIQALIEEIEDAVDSIPVDYSGLLATIAADYSSSKTYQVGQYAWQGGVLKRCIVPITTAETYTAAHWTNAVLGDDVSALKSAIDEISFITEKATIVTDNITQTHSGVTYYKESENEIGIYGTSGSASQRLACFNGNNTFSTQASTNPPKNIQAGTYTARISGVSDKVIEVYYTTSTFGTVSVKLNDGDTFSASSDFTLFILVYSQKTVGTQENPSIVSVELFTGSGESTAVDRIARSEIETLKKIKYVATSGNDNNDGNTVQTPYATIGKAISETPDIIYVAKGTYTEAQIYENTKLRYSGIKIICDNATLIMPVSGIQFRYANVDISGLTVNVTNASGESSYGFLLLNCTGKMTDCTVIGAKGAGGFRLDGSRVTLTRCVVANCAVDGFNGHTVNTGYETEVTLIDCIAHDCGDDGASIHESGKMYVIGGEYYNNAQTGLAPHDLCVFEALNVHCHNNGIGIEAVKDTLSTGETPAVGRVIGCILDHNTTYGLDVKNYTVNALGNAYADNGTGKTRTGTGATINAFTAD